ncbi:MAG: sensor histidine kinase [Bryobacterales bacterium]|nr:sensor histidine kinase [Bryobacterales bacterium]
MRSRSWIILSAGFGSLIACIILMGLGAMRRAEAIHDESIATHNAYLKTDSLVGELPADLYLSGILVRDYLLDLSHLTGPLYRGEMRRLQTSVKQKLDVLERTVPKRQQESLDRLTEELNGYWKALDPLFEWSPQRKAILSNVFLRDVVLPRRDSIIKLAQEVARINGENLASEQRRLDESQNLFQQFLKDILLVTVAVALLVSLASIYRVNNLEREHHLQRVRAERAEGELRRLSRKLVRAQEEERKAISRELHDALGQKLSFIGMEVGTLSSLRMASPEVFEERLSDAQRLITETVRSVRDLSMSLRPAMLDELGLGSAVRWQGREFARRSGIDVDVQLDGELDALPETHRTAIYRIVQEALTNIAKHAAAKSVRIHLYGGKDAIRLTVQDDGKGFDPERIASRGIGLVGMEERMKELGGTITVRSSQGKGTSIEAAVPLAAGSEVSL